MRSSALGATLGAGPSVSAGPTFVTSGTIGVMATIDSGFPTTGMSGSDGDVGELGGIGTSGDIGDRDVSGSGISSSAGAGSDEELPQPVSRSAKRQEASSARPCGVARDG